MFCLCRNVSVCLILFGLLFVSIVSELNVCFWILLIWLCRMLKLSLYWWIVFDRIGWLIFEFVKVSCSRWLLFVFSCLVMCVFSVGGSFCVIMLLISVCVIL